jgi:lipopolysaccharide biosynthesis regulator YciM
MLAFRFAILLACTPGMVAAQVSPSSTITVQVRVLTPAGERVSTPLKVELLTGTGHYLSTAFSDSIGMTSFAGLRPGNYRIRVSGVGYEETTTNVFSISSAQRTHTEHVAVRPKTGDASPGSPTPTVAAVDLNVPEKARDQLERGDKAAARGDWALALKQYQKALETYPRYARAYNNMGVVHMRSGDTPRGREAFEKAISINDNYTSAYVNLARVMQLENKLPEAEAVLQKALAFNPSEPETLAVLARVQLLGGKLDEAIANARKVHTLPHEGYAMAHYFAGLGLRAKEMNSEAVEEFRTYLKEAPEGSFATQAQQALTMLEAKR